MWEISIGHRNRVYDDFTLAKTLEYLEASNKIHLPEDGSIVWVFVDNPKLLRLLRTSHVIKHAGTRTSTDTSSGLVHRNVRKKKTARMINKRNRRRGSLRVRTHKFELEVVG